jgi:protein CpxP
MKHRNLVLTTLLAGSLVTAGFVTISYAGPQYCAHHGMHSKRMGDAEGRHDPLKRLMGHLDLTDAQQTEIKTIIATGRSDMKGVRQQLHDSRRAIYELVASSNYSAERVRELADQQAKLNAELTVARMDTMHRTLQVLTPEQRAELAKLREQRMEKKKVWMEEHRKN